MRPRCTLAAAALAVGIMFANQPVFAQSPLARAYGQPGQADAAPAARKPRTAPARSSTPIACTRAGCHPIPRGCWIEIERNWDGLPTGFDAVVCPYR